MLGVTERIGQAALNFRKEARGAIERTIPGTFPHKESPQIDINLSSGDAGFLVDSRGNMIRVITFNLPSANSTASPPEPAIMAI